MMVRFEDVPLKPRGKWKRKKTKYEAVDGDEGDSSYDEEDTLYSSDGYISVDTDADEEELKEEIIVIDVLDGLSAMAGNGGVRGIKTPIYNLLHIELKLLRVLLKLYHF